MNKRINKYSVITPLLLTFEGMQLKCTLSCARHMSFSLYLNVAWTLYRWQLWMEYRCPVYRIWLLNDFMCPL